MRREEEEELVAVVRVPMWQVLLVLLMVLTIKRPILLAVDVEAKVDDHCHCTKYR
jgi:hypothetical protein